MTSKAELDKGIAAIKSAYRRESNARNVLAHMLDEKERDNAKLRELCADMWVELHCKGAGFSVHQAADEFFERMQELGVEVE